MKSRPETSTQHSWQPAQGSWEREHRQLHFEWQIMETLSKEADPRTDLSSKMEWIWVNELKYQFLRVSIWETDRLNEDDNESWDPNPKPGFTLDYTAAPKATGRWVLKWVIIHWSMSFSKPDQTKTVSPNFQG